jgi:protein-S-isoprenylcysteine O-methyltransferase Ste14
VNGGNMETLVSQEKNQKLVKALSWILIFVSAIVLLRSIFFSQGYSAMITMQGITKNFDPPIGINFSLYFIQNAVELLLCMVVYVSAVHVLNFNKKWRQVLVYSLIASIIFLIMSPIITYYNVHSIIVGFPKTSRLIWSYIWSIILSAFFIFVIMKLSKEEVKLLFR